ncbi:hypothetical protein ACWEQH_41935 [Streptomyces sp. NPDC004166]
MSGWTDTVRPPTSYTNPLKAQGTIVYGCSDTNTADYEEAHLVPLELGGAPQANGNLWPEPYFVPVQGGRWPSRTSCLQTPA